MELRGRWSLWCTCPSRPEAGGWGSRGHSGSPCCVPAGKQAAGTCRTAPQPSPAAFWDTLYSRLWKEQWSWSNVSYYQQLTVILLFLSLKLTIKTVNGGPNGPNTNYMTWHDPFSLLMHIPFAQSQHSKYQTFSFTSSLKRHSCIYVTH